MIRQSNGQRPLWASFRDGFDGMRDVSHGRIMRFIFTAIAAALLAGFLRQFVAQPLAPLGWILLVGGSGMMCSFCTSILVRVTARVNLRKHPSAWGEALG